MLPIYAVDPSPLSALDGTRPVAAAVDCEGVSDHVLGVSVAVASRKAGALAWGHASLRVVRCAEGALRDDEYETYRLGPWNERLLRLEHGAADYVSEASLAPRRGGLVLFRNAAVVDAGWWGHVGADENRDLWEVWLDLPQERLDAIGADADTWYERQRETLRSGDPLPERYVAWRRNCTAVLRDLIPELDPGSALPFVWLRDLEDQAAERVVHPSPHLQGRLDGAAQTPRRRFVVRGWGAPAPPDAQALGPWATGRP